MASIRVCLESVRETRGDVFAEGVVREMHRGANKERVLEFELAHEGEEGRGRRTHLHGEEFRADRAVPVGIQEVAPKLADEFTPRERGERGGVRLIPPLYNTILETCSHKFDAVRDVDAFVREVAETSLLPVRYDLRGEVASREHGRLFQVGM